ncbi:cellobiose phosphotransferase system YdjC-like protein [Aquipluma nitroreducens]|uniref:Cellobiose phosphotransferase system YdjC-like protein n=1 Tax=Aquipluma nitroreducens TaxID=2010828 RepID=A0A5K7SH45_9BACT|nr:ChbG/HpnK family deacetylase [Aquipluma nitroreducens]BBE20574.1 cellobiose phosphotransferase system YdjC-like protein [Aquipluma nitroreducens]
MANKEYSKNIIVNADDFGLKSSVNKAIVESFNKNLINSTTIMANMPGFEEAVELAFKHKFNDRLGVHLNLDAGYHLTSHSEITRILDRNNHFKFKDVRMIFFFLSGYEKKLIHQEFVAQIERVIKTGIKITHIDTHHHIHEIFPITKIIFPLLKTYNISSIRILNNINKSTAFYKIGYRRLVNNRIKINNRNLTDYFGNQLDVSSLLQKYPSLCENKKIEVMVHPDYDKNGKLIDWLGGKEHNFDSLMNIKSTQD